MENSNKDKADNRLAWLDLEMTGLDTVNDEIIEMAIVVTDRQLQVVAESKTWVFACAEAKLAAMDSWNTKTHGSSGLLDDVRASSLDYATGQAQALEFLREWVTAGRSPMCGNTICQDRRFLHRLMPTLHQYFHYRNFDVSTFKQAMGYWYGSLVPSAKKENVHRAMADIHESIEEMQYYHQLLFRA